MIFQGIKCERLLILIIIVSNVCRAVRTGSADCGRAGVGRGEGMVELDDVLCGGNF
jgi:hypothetical protein